MKEVGLYYPEEWWSYNAEQLAEICNGCGPAGLKFDIIPDRLWWLDISDACNIHDFMYVTAPGCSAEKEKADEAFLYNMLKIIENGTRSWWLRWLRRKAAKRYYLAVKFFGGPAFWAGK